jgi:hypothetical protein
MQQNSAKRHKYLPLNDVSVSFLALRGGSDAELNASGRIGSGDRQLPEPEIFCRDEKISVGGDEEAIHAQDRFRPQKRDGIDLIGDGAVTKSIVRKGRGTESPKEGDMVYIHYRASIANGRDFDDSRCRETAESRQGLPFGFTLGKGEVSCPARPILSIL